MSDRFRYRALRILLIFVIGILLGALFQPLNRFLNQQLDTMLAFFSGHPLEAETTAWQKVQHDLGLAPWRATRQPASSGDFDFESLRLAPALQSILPESTLELYLDESAAGLANYAGLLIKTQVDNGRGYSPGLLLVGFDGKVHRQIPLQPVEHCNCNARFELGYFHVAGDPAELQQSGNQLLNLNSCGAAEWSLDSRYGFHHYLNNDGDHHHADFWILDATDLVQVETASGKVLQRLSLSEIINANHDLPLFEARLKGSRPERWVYGDAEFAPIGRTHSAVSNADPDPFHTNDIDSFRGEDSGLFQRGDLALSFRSLNLLVVIRPASRKVVWYAYGLTSRQHDPDFLSADSLMVYDNNFHNANSRVLRLQAAASPGKAAGFSTERHDLVNSINGTPFQQLIEGYQFFIDDRRSLVLSAENHNYGVDTETGEVFLALRHRWREQAFLAVDIERLVTRSEFNDIREASCSG